ncbi:MAG: hypothetical protein ACJ8C4_06415 [Gemmataceae bacterium]
MTRMFHATVILLFAAAPAFSQCEAIYVPQSSAYVGVSAGPMFGYYPGAFGGQWSNGYSLYGPPVPTYGTVPGYFGGSDQRLSNFPDLRSNWYYGPYGYRGVVIPLNAPKPVIIVVPMAVCEIRVPDPDAQVMINGSPWSVAGSVRRFETRLPHGVASNCEIEAKWAGASGIGMGKRSVIMRAGETAVADFTKPGT